MNTEEEMNREGELLRIPFLRVNKSKEKKTPNEKNFDLLSHTLCKRIKK